MPISIAALKYVLASLVVLAVLAGVYALGFSRAETAWKLKLEQQIAATQAAAIAQEAKVNDAEHRMAEAATARDTLRAQLDTSIAATAGLAQRVQILSASLRARQVPAAGGSAGAEATKPGGAQCAGQLTAAMQRVYDAARADGIALQVLGARKVCECAN